jgi:hypothetical protein
MCGERDRISMHDLAGLIHYVNHAFGHENSSR